MGLHSLPRPLQRSQCCLFSILEAAYAGVFTCQNEIEKSLHDPGSAQFSSDEVGEHSAWTWKSTGKIQRAIWTVRAKNRLGNYVGENMTCWFDEDGNFQRVTSG